MRPLHAAYDVLSGALSLVLALGRVEGVADGERHAVVGVVGALAAEDIALVEGVVAEVEEGVVACGVEYVRAGEAHSQRLVSQEGLLDDCREVPVVVEQPRVAVVGLGVEVRVELQLFGTDRTIPVSRSRLKEIKEQRQGDRDDGKNHVTA